MITVRLKGGLGNQMFQHAFARAYSLKNNVPFQLDVRYLKDRSPRKNFIYRNYDLDIFNINPVILKPVDYFPYAIYSVLMAEALQCKFPSLKKITNKYLEKDYLIDKNIWSENSFTYFSGYFQSYKYFSEYKDQIADDFTFRNCLDNNCQPLMQEVRMQETICLNVRRGDFLNDKLLNVVSKNYYYRSVDFIKSKVNNPVIYVFSDDTKWCEENLKFDIPTVYITHEFAGVKFRNYFELMMNCKHFIIPNSSFAWWAAYLSKSINKIVVVPSIWQNDSKANSKDLVPDNWYKKDPSTIKDISKASLSTSK